MSIQNWNLGKFKMPGAKPAGGAHPGAPAGNPAPAPKAEDHEQGEQQGLLGNLASHEQASPLDYRAAVHQQGTSALNDAVEKTNEAWSQEMDRRADMAGDEYQRQHERSLAAMQYDALAQHDAFEAERDQQRRAFLGNLLGSETGTHTVRYG